GDDGHGGRGGGERMEMFWLDAAEYNGMIYLMGKVAMEENTATTSDSNSNCSRTYVSACVVVHGIERELLVLPRYSTRQG
ncbi:unnamed protein product, partial [Discosporangium mesarthrocarpum]